MATGNRAPKVKRTFVLGPVLGDDGQISKQRAEAEEKVFDLLGALWTVGGVVRIVADRIQVGTLPASGSDQAEPMGETVGLIIEYQANTQMNKTSVTARLEDLIYADDVDRADALATRLAEVPAVREAVGDEDDDGDDEDDAGGSAGEE